MDFPKSVPGVGLVNGKFIDEDPLAATPGSLIPSVWGNSVTLELLKVIEDAGLVPDEDDNTQLSAAIDHKITESSVAFASQAEAEAGESPTKAMSPLRVFQAIAKLITQATESTFGWLKIATQAQVNAGTDDAAAVTSKKLATALQNQVVQAFTTSGTGTALTLTPSPAISAYAANQRFSVKFHVGSGANPTLNVSAKGPKALKQYGAAGAKVAAVFFADQLGDVVCDGEDFILLGQASSSTGTTPAQFDNSNKLATTAFVQGVGLQFSALIIPAASMTLTAAAAGSVIVSNSSTAITITLPAASTIPGKTAIKFWNYAAGAMTIAVTGPDSIYLPSTNTSFVVTIGSFITLVSNGGSGWYAVDMSGAGTGQTYFNMTGLRVSGTTYPNSTGKEIEVTVNLTSGPGGSVFSATVAGSAVKTSGQGVATTNLSLSFKVPAGSTYSFSSGSGSIVSVWEYR